MDPVAERGVWLGPESIPAHRADLAAFVERAARLDAAAVVRLRARSGGEFTAWAVTGLDVLASRVVAGTVRPDDLSVGADELARGLSAVDSSGYVDPGFPMDSAWRGALPPDSGFAHLDDVPVSPCDVYSRSPQWVSCRSRPRLSMPTRLCGFAFCGRGCASMRGGVRCIGVTVTRCWCCVDQGS